MTGHGGRTHERHGASGALPRRRRDPYPVSPVIGPEGTRAAQEMVEAARALFLDRGYHATSTVAIAESTGRSDTAFYQYFHGKQQIFKIFFEELGEDLAAHFEALPDITPDAGGLHHLQGWIGGMGQLLTRHSPVFMEWPEAPLDEEPEENPQERYFARFVAAIEARVADPDVPGVGGRAFAIALVSIVAWSRFVLAARDAAWSSSAPTADELDAVLARLVHRTLFPLSGRAPYHAGAPGDPGRTTEQAEVPAPLPDRDRTPPGLRRSITPRTSATVHRLLDSALAEFDRHGLAGTAVDDITRRAGVAHGTFYNYWTDRDAVFTTLTDAASAEVRRLWPALPRAVAEGRTDEWLAAWLDVVARHGVTFHLWTSEIATRTTVRALDTEMMEVVEGVTGELLKRQAAPVAPGVAATGIALWAVLTEFPYATWRHFPVLTRDEVQAALSSLLHRGFLS